MLNFILSETTWQPDRTIPTHKGYENKEMFWCAGDTEKLYEKQGNRSYNKNDITYKFNSLGYRSAEFDVSGPKLLAIGCSTVFGTGLPLHEMFVELVSKNLGVICCNLALPGRSNDYIARLLEVSVSIIDPDYVLVNFTYPQRREFWTHSGNLVTYHPGMATRSSNGVDQIYCSKLLRDIGNPNEDLSNFYKNYLLVSKILQGRCWAFSSIVNLFPRHFQGLYEPERYAGNLVALGDLARDGVHSGRASNFKMALTYNKIFGSIRTSP